MPAPVRAAMRHILLRARLIRLPRTRQLDPHSPEYLLLVQQAKRLSLSASIGRLRPRNVLLLPWLLIVIPAKAIDLWIANQIIRAMLNERDLIARIRARDE